MSFDGRPEWLGFLRSERILTSFGLGLLLIFGLLDFVEDRAAGAAMEVVLADVADLILPIGLLTYIWFNQPLLMRRSLSNMKANEAKRSADLDHWRGIATSYLEGLSAGIDSQFDRWGLTPSEKEVGLLLLKGLSMKEIAEIRSVSERTARQQAGVVYSKSELKGRAELSAFFLEDLLLPEVGSP